METRIHILIFFLLIFLYLKGLQCNNLLQLIIYIQYDFENKTLDIQKAKKNGWIFHVFGRRHELLAGDVVTNLRELSEAVP